MARIYKRGKKWAYRIYAGIDPVTGKEIKRSKSGFLKEKDAKLAAALVERQINNGDYIQPSKITFESLCDNWEGHYISQGAKESSLRARKIALKHIISELGYLPIQRITKKSYQDTIDALADKFSVNYVSSIHSSAHMVFEYARENRLIQDNPASGVKLPKKKVTVEELESGQAVNEKYLEKVELGEFLTVAKNEGLEADLLTFTLLAYTGLRVGEMVALKWSEIDLSNHTLRVIRTYYNPTNNKLKYQLLTPKTEKSIRTITIDPLLIGLLQEYKKQQQQTMKDNKPFYHDNGFIFATNEGYPKTIKNISTRMQRLLKKTTIKKHLTPHSFRHTHTSLLAQAGVSLPEIMERLGHDDEDTTKKIYLHVTKDMKKEASTKFGNLMKDLSENLTG